MDDPSETAVSRDSRMEVNGHTQPCVPSSARPETEGAGGDVAEKQDAEKLSPKKVVSTIVLKATGAGDQGETQPQTQVPDMWLLVTLPFLDSKQDSYHLTREEQL